MTLNVSIGIYGPAEMVLSGDIYDELMVYYNHFRPESTHQELLLNWGGSKMTPGTLINGLCKELAAVEIEKR